MKKYKLIRGLGQEISLNIREELRAWYEIFYSNKLYTAIILVLLIYVTIQFNPFPPSQVFIGSGQKGSSYRSLGKEFSSYFQHYNIDLQTVESQGLSEDLNRVIAPESPVSAGFYVAGSKQAEAIHDVVSLGSINFSPIWIFYRGNESNQPDNLIHLLKKRFAVGSNQRSSTNAIFAKIASLHGLDINTAPNFIQMPHMVAADKLRRGEIDAMVVVDSIDSPLIQSLLHDHEIHVNDFILADAYIKHFPFLHEVVIPPGSLDINRNHPTKPIHLLSTTVTLLVEYGTHPVIQWIFLKAARHISDLRREFFSEPGYFPAYLDHSIPLSKVAKRFYQDGLPPLANFVPLWLADFIDRIWFYVLAGVTVFIPALRMLVASRTYYSNQIIENSFIHLRDIGYRVPGLQTIEEANQLRVEIEELKQNVEGTWIASINIRDYYTLKSRIKGVSDEITQKGAALKIKEEAIDY